MKNKYMKFLAAAAAVMVFTGSVENSRADVVPGSEAEKVVQTTSSSAAEKVTIPKITVKVPKVTKGYVNNKPSLTWNKNNSKDSYEIWASGKPNGKYIKKATTKSRNYKLDNLIPGKLYYIKLRASRTVNNKVYKSAFSRVTKVMNNVKLKNVQSSFAGTMNVSWEKANTASGYCIQYSTDKNFKKVKTIKVRQKSKDFMNLYDLQQDKIYYVRIRTFQKVGKKTMLSMWSAAKTIKVAGASNIINGDFKNTEGYFKNSVFFGDSVLQGFQIYTRNKGRGYLDNSKVMGVVSYSLVAALQNDSKYHPLYQGKHMAPQYITQSLGAEKVFLFFGINDLHGASNAEYTYNNYKELIRKIKAVNPGVKVHVISTTYPMKGSENYVNYAKNIRRLNQLMRDYCVATDCEYIDIASYLATADGYLKSELCSDNFVHQTMQAYEIWDKVLRAYAWNYNHLGK